MALNFDAVLSHVGAVKPRDALLTPVRLGEHTLRNRIVMASMTRSRADEAGRVGLLTAQYYAQRAGAGLLVSEGLYPSAIGRSYVRTPGLVDDSHIPGWRSVTDGVHASGGLIAAQLMHAGRVSDPSILPAGERPVAPSAIAAKGEFYAEGGKKPFALPRALSIPEIQQTIEDYVSAALRAMEADFDGVQLHAGSGYLPMQFLSSHANNRKDAYGGSVANRVRFVVELLEALCGAVGAGRVSLKITPDMAYNDAGDDNASETYRTLAQAISHLRLAYVDVVSYGAETDYHALLRPLLRTPYVRGGRLSPAEGRSLVEQGEAEAVAYGRAFIANPDLVARIAAGADLAEADPATFYSSGARGYTDYPRASATPATTVR